MAIRTTTAVISRYVIFAAALVLPVAGLIPVYLYRTPSVYPRAFDVQQANVPGDKRLVYPYSVVPGGVASVQEVRGAALKDKVVDAHYNGVDISALQREVAGVSQAIYISYRKGNSVYWTKHRVRLAKGELLLSDGKNRIRMRCGNRVAQIPQDPTSDNEPSEVALDTPVPPDSDGRSKETTAATPSVPSNLSVLSTGVAPAFVIGAHGAFERRRLGSDTAPGLSPVVGGRQEPIRAGVETTQPSVTLLIGWTPQQLTPVGNRPPADSDPGSHEPEKAQAPQTTQTPSTPDNPWTSCRPVNLLELKDSARETPEVPEPATWITFVTGLLGVVYWRKRPARNYRDCRK
jgi:hypothetical protein